MRFNPAVVPQQPRQATEELAVAQWASTVSLLVIDIMRGNGLRAVPSGAGLRGSLPATPPRGTIL